MTIDRPGHAYAADITYIPMARGAMYLTAVIDWHSRKALAYRVSNTMDGKGRWLDNVYVERFWRNPRWKRSICMRMQGQSRRESASVTSTKKIRTRALTT